MGARAAWILVVLAWSGRPWSASCSFDAGWDSAQAVVGSQPPSPTPSQPQRVIAGSSAGAAPTTRDLERINWQEFREWVPGRIDTVLLPLGTLEPHGVTANGADILAPVAIARTLAPRVNALVAPVVPYGFTGSMDAYPGAFTVPESVYRDYVRAVLVGLAKNQFRNIVLINGHGGGQTAVLSAVASEVGREAHVRTLVVNWWSYCSDVTLEVFGEDGGHAGNNETSFMLALDPALVHKDRYTGPEMTSAVPAPNTWSAYPTPSSITLYKAGQGYPVFDAVKARQYVDKVNAKLEALISDTIRKWNLAGL
jgi:creatinine amidohydrolase